MSLTIPRRPPADRDAPEPRPATVVLRWWREVLLVGLLYAAYDTSRGLAHTDRSRALHNGAAILRWERSIHLAPEQALNHWLDACTPLAVSASYIYSTLHYIVTPVVLIWMFRSHRAHYLTARTALACATLLALAMYFLVPTAPPRMVAGSGIHDTLAGVASYGWWSHDGSVPRGLGDLTNQVAAMPSLHVGWAVWCGVLIVRHARRRWLRGLGVLYPVVIAMVVMATGNHYLLDAVAGAAVVAAGALVALGLRRFGSRTSGRKAQAV